MPMIKLTPFSGMTPRTGKRLLGNEGSQDCTNLKIQSGELRPLREPGLVSTPAAPKTIGSTDTQVSIFKARSGLTDSEWFTWPDLDVDCVRVPLSTEVESRFCWTGDGIPKFAKYSNAVSGGLNNYPLLANELTLGIPAPQVAPTASHSGGTGSAATRYYCYTFFSQDGEESAPSPVSLVATGKVDGTWSIAAMNSAPLNTGSVSGAVRVGNVITVTTSAAHWLRAGETLTIAAVGGITETNGTWTIDSVPSTTTFKITVTAAVTSTYTSGGTWTRATKWNTTGMTKRLYRTTGSLGTFQLVAENLAIGTATYSDTLTDALILGDELISSGWEPPPVGLKGLCVHSSGALVGFSGNLMCFSEPLQPHAWVTSNQLSSGYDGVGLATFGSSVVMATAGMPFVATGTEPASMTGEDVTGMYPCLSKRSVISVGNGVLYASKHGLVQVGSNGISMFTDPFYTRDEWELLNPETMFAATANGRVYVGYTDNNVTAMLIFDGPILVKSSVPVLELYADVSSGELYVATELGISVWDDPAEVVLQGYWKSKEFVFPQPINIGAGKVEYTLAIDPTIAAAIEAAIAAITASNTALLRSTVTMTSANPCVVARTAHGLHTDDRIAFRTTGALPTNVVAGTDYYVLAAGLTADTFRISATSGGTAIDGTTGTQSGTHYSYVFTDVGGDINGEAYGEMYINGSSLAPPPEAPPSNLVTVTLFSEGKPVATRVVDSTRVFRFPSGYKRDNFAVQITSQCVVREIRLSETPDGLRVA